MWRRRRPVGDETFPQLALFQHRFMGRDACTVSYTSSKILLVDHFDYEDTVKYPVACIGMIIRLR